MGWSGIKEYGFGSKNRTPEEDAEYRSRIKGVPRQITWTKEKCIGELNDILQILKKVLREDEKLEKNNPRRLKQETVRDCVTLMNRILDYMKYLYPPVQQTVTYNLTTDFEEFISRLKEWKKKKLEEQNVVEVKNEQEEKS